MISYLRDGHVHGYRFPEALIDELKRRGISYACVLTRNWVSSPDKQRDLFNLAADNHIQIELGSELYGYTEGIMSGAFIALGLNPKNPEIMKIWGPTEDNLRNFERRAQHFADFLFNDRGYIVPNEYLGRDLVGEIVRTAINPVDAHLELVRIIAGSRENEDRICSELFLAYTRQEFENRPCCQNLKRWAQNPEAPIPFEAMRGIEKYFFTEYFAYGKSGYLPLPNQAEPWDIVESVKSAGGKVLYSVEKADDFFKCQRWLKEIDGVCITYPEWANHRQKMEGFANQGKIVIIGSDYDSYDREAGIDLRRCPAYVSDSFERLRYCRV